MRPVSILPPVLVAAVVAAAALVLSHGSGPSTTSAAVVTGTERIDISHFAYYPASVRVGTMVIFTNEESVEHTATSNAEGLFETGTLEKGHSVRLKMNKVGTFSYHCSFHAFMHGTIKVVP